MNEKIDLVLEELTRIRILLEFAIKSRIIEEIREIASTDERKKIWELLTGDISTDEIANRTQISQRAVQIFVKELSERNLIDMNKRGYPKRKFDITSIKW